MSAPAEAERVARAALTWVAEPGDQAMGALLRVCDAMARRGVLTRPIGNVIVLMPPYCTTAKQGHKMVSALEAAIREVFGSRGL